jgi:hypothetical protein
LKSPLFSYNFYDEEIRAASSTVSPIENVYTIRGSFESFILPNWISFISYGAKII